MRKTERSERRNNRIRNVLSSLVGVWRNGEETDEMHALLEEALSAPETDVLVSEYADILAERYPAFIASMRMIASSCAMEATGPNGEDLVLAGRLFVVPLHGNLAHIERLVDSEVNEHFSAQIRASGLAAPDAQVWMPGFLLPAEEAAYSGAAAIRALTVAMMRAVAEAGDHGVNAENFEEVERALETLGAYRPSGEAEETPPGARSMTNVADILTIGIRTVVRPAETFATAPPADWFDGGDASESEGDPPSIQDDETDTAADDAEVEDAFLDAADRVLVEADLDVVSDIPCVWDRGLAMMAMNRLKAGIEAEARLSGVEQPFPAETVHLAADDDGLLVSVVCNGEVFGPIDLPAPLVSAEMDYVTDEIAELGGTVAEHEDFSTLPRRGGRYLH